MADNPDQPFYSVALYLEDRLYGGPEEGGWYFSAGRPVDWAEVDGLIPFEAWAPTYYQGADQAAADCERINAEHGEALNDGRREISSVLSEGRYGWQVTEGHPVAYPARKPVYE